MSHRKIKLPPQVVAELGERSRDGARSIASSLVGLAIVAFVFGVVALGLLVAFAAGLVNAWIACAVPTCSACGLAIVACGVALDVIREVKPRE